MHGPLIETLARQGVTRRTFMKYCATLASMMALFAYFLPLPFIFLEIIIGIIQALIFAMLTLVFITIATQDHAEEN